MAIGWEPDDRDAVLRCEAKPPNPSAPVYLDPSVSSLPPSPRSRAARSAPSPPAFWATAKNANKRATDKNCISKDRMSLPLP